MEQKVSIKGEAGLSVIFQFPWQSFVLNHWFCLLVQQQVKISQDGRLPQAATNGNMSNGNSKKRENPDKEEEGEETGGKMLPEWDLWNNLKRGVN